MYFTYFIYSIFHFCIVASFWSSQRLVFPFITSGRKKENGLNCSDSFPFTDSNIDLRICHLHCIFGEKLWALHLSGCYHLHNLTKKKSFGFPSSSPQELTIECRSTWQLIHYNTSWKSSQNLPLAPPLFSGDPFSVVLHSHAGYRKLYQTAKQTRFNSRFCFRIDKNKNVVNQGGQCCLVVPGPLNTTL